jgi:hypothetical protein
MAALVAYVLSRTIGLPQIRDDVGNWTEPWGIAAVAVESLLLVLSLAVLLGSRREGEPVGKDASGRFARV